MMITMDADIADCTPVSIDALADEVQRRLSAECPHR